MFTRPASPFKQMLARPGSPDRHARSPSKTQASADRWNSPPKQRWFGSVSSHTGGASSQASVQSRMGLSQASMCTEQNSMSARTSPAPSVLLRPPSTYGYRNEQTASPAAANVLPHSPNSHTTVQAQHVDVILESEQDACILPYLGDVVMDTSDVDLSNTTIDMTLNTTASGMSIHPVSASTNVRTESCREEFEARLFELVETERSYVQRLDVLYSRYAQPLRQMARDRDTAIIPAYEAQKLFGNIGEVLGANTALLHDLDRYLQDRTGSEDDAFELASVLYRNMMCMSCYNEYLANFEKAKHIEQTMMRSNKGFRDFVDRTKRSVRDIGNVGLRELLMEPVQRIPRYILLMQALSKSCASADPACSRLDQAVLVANRIARCDVDDKTKRAAVQWSLTRNIESFPPALISVNRRLIDCIDVDDYPLDSYGRLAKSPLLSPSAGLSQHAAPRALHCALLLFDDVLVVVKRAHSSTCTRSLLGLDNLNTLADEMKTVMERSNGALTRSNAPSLSFRGHIDLSDVQISDLGACDLQMILSKPPLSVTGEKWATRLVRQYVAVDVTNHSTPEATAIRQTKTRFMESIWQRQALYRVSDESTHVRCSVTPCTSGKAKQFTYWIVYSDREAYELELRKSKTVLHVDTASQHEHDTHLIGSDRAAVIINLSRLDEAESACRVIIRTPTTEAFEAQPQDWMLEELPHMISEASPREDMPTDFGLSRPSTPASSQRSKVLGAGLEQFGRTIFGSPGSIRSTAGSDIFGVRRALSKGSSHHSRNASVSTRMTFSSTNSGSVASRDMLGKSAFGGSPRDDAKLKADIARYQQAVSPAPNVFNAEPILPGSTFEKEPMSPSPSRRKPSALDNSQMRRASNGSKRSFPMEDAAEKQPCKRSTFNHHDDDISARHAEMAPAVPPKSPQPDLVVSKENYRPSPSRTRNVRSASGTVRPLGVRDDNKLHSSYDDDESACYTGNETIREMGTAGKGPSQAIQKVGREAQGDLDHLREAVEKAHDVLKRLLERMNERGRAEVSSCLLELDDAMLVQGRIQSSVAALLAAAIQQKGAIAGAGSSSAAEMAKLRTEVATLTHRCKTLAELEKDGRLENTALHNAFNEELDRMYDDANLGEVEQIASLRTAVRQTTAQRNEAKAEVRALQKELRLANAQSEAWREILVKHNLL